jgi:hypothetical protein
MNTWDVLRERARSLDQSVYRWRSHTRYLLAIFDQSEEWGLDPDIPNSASISNLCEIIVDARQAIEEGRRKRLNELFQMAADLTNRELRIALRGGNRPEITVKRVGGENDALYAFRVNKAQFERIRNATETSFNYKVDTD